MLRILRQSGHFPSGASSFSGLDYAVSVHRFHEVPAPAFARMTAGDVTFAGTGLHSFAGMTVSGAHGENPRAPRCRFRPAQGRVRRNLRAEPQIAKVGIAHIQLVLQTTWHTPAQLVPDEDQFYDAAVVVSGDAMPFIQWRAGQPVIVFIPTCAVGGVVERNQRFLVRFR